MFFVILVHVSQKRAYFWVSDNFCSSFDRKIMVFRYVVQNLMLIRICYSVFKFDPFFIEFWLAKVKHRKIVFISKRGAASPPILT